MLGCWPAAASPQLSHELTALGTPGGPTPPGVSAGSIPPPRSGFRATRQLLQISKHFSLPRAHPGGSLGWGLAASSLCSLLLLAAPHPTDRSSYWPLLTVPSSAQTPREPPAFPWQHCALGLSHRNGFEELRAAPSVGMGASCCPEPRCWVVNGPIQDEISIFGRRV